MGDPRSKDHELRQMYADYDAKLTSSELKAWGLFLAGAGLPSIAGALGRTLQATDRWLDAQTKLRPYRDLDGTLILKPRPERMK